MSRALSVLLLVSGLLLGPLEARGTELASPSCGAVKPRAMARLQSLHVTIVEDGLSPEVIQRVMRQNFGRFRLCYEYGLRNCPNLQGRVAVDFTIMPNGTVKGARVTRSDIPDARVGTCVVKQMAELTFPCFKGKPIKVSYPIMFTPGG